MPAGADPRAWFGPDDAPRYARPARAEEAEAGTVSALRAGQLASFRRTGVVVLRGAAPEPLCREAIDALRPHFERTGALRLTNAAWALEPLRVLAALPEIIDLLTFLYGRRPVAFQSLDFQTGTQQDLHRDDSHFDSLPPGYLCGVWIALERIGPRQGPLIYAGLQGGALSELGDRDVVPFTADAGDAIVWSAPVVHGGAPILDGGSSRWSHVTHYFFEDCVWYTPRHSDLATGALRLRHPLIDLVTGRPVTPRLGGRPARFVHGPGRRSQVVPPGHPSPGWPRRAPWRGAPGALGQLVQARWSRATGRLPRQ